MALSTSQKFLVEANRVAGAADYFRWREIGETLGYSEAQSDEAVRSLGERKLVILLMAGDAKLLASGRALASRLAAKSRDNEPQARKPARRDRVAGTDDKWRPRGTPRGA